MGKRKSSAKAPPKKARAKVAVAFSCPFCNAEKSVHCEMDREARLGQARCTLCGAQFTGKIHSLSEPIDIYSEWIDECEAANAEETENQRETR